MSSTKYLLHLIVWIVIAIFSVGWMLDEPSINAPRLFTIKLVGVFIALSISIIAYGLSLSNRNRLIPYIGLAYLAVGLTDLLQMLNVYEVFLPKTIFADLLLHHGATISNVILSSLFILGIVNIARNPDHRPNMGRYAIFIIGLSSALTLIFALSPINSNSIVILETGSNYGKAIQVCAYLMIIPLLLFFRNRPNFNREWHLGLALTAAIFLEISALFFSIYSQESSITVLDTSTILSILGKTAALVAICTIWRQYSKYSFEVSSLHLTSIISILFLALLLNSIVEFFDNYTLKKELVANEQKQRLALNFQAKVHTLTNKMYGYLLFPKRAIKSDIINDLEKLASGYLVSSKLKSPVPGHFTSNIHQEIENLHTVAVKIFSLGLPLKEDDAVEIYRKLSIISNRFTDQVHSTAHREESKLDTTKSNSDQKEHGLFLLKLTILIFLLTLFLYLSARHTQRQIQPIIRLSRAAKSLSEGHHVPELYIRRKDEIGLLCDNFYNMVKQLNNVFHSLEERVQHRTATLERNENHLRNLMQNLEEGVIVADSKLIIQSINRAGCEMFGYSNYELVGKPLNYLLPEEYLNISNPRKIAAIYKSTSLPHNQPTTNKLIGFRKNESIFLMEISLSKIVESDSQTTVAIIRNITTAQIAEDELRASKERLDQFFRASMEGLLFCEQNKVTDANDTVADMIQCEVSRITGKNIHSFFPVEHHSRVLDSLTQASALFEVEILRSNDERVPVELKTHCVLQNDKRCCVIAIRDISERLDAQMNLDKQTFYTEKILEVAGALMMVVDRAGKIRRYNRACTINSGYSYEEVKGQFLWSLANNSDDKSRLKDIFCRNDLKDFPSQLSFSWITKMGDTRELEWNNTVIMSNESEIESVIFAGFDVTDKKMQTRKLTEDKEILGKEVAERTHELSAIFNLSPDGFVSMNSNQRIVSVNPAFLEMVNKDSNDIIGLNKQELYRFIISLCDDTNSKLSFTPDNIETGTIFHLNTPSKLTIKCTQRAIRDVENSPHGEIIYFQDISQEVELDRRKSEFVSTAAHELRTPLSSILGFSELLISKEFEPEKQKNMLEIIVRQSSNLKSILNDLLDLARIDSRGSKDFDLETGDLKNVVTHVCKEFEGIYNNHVMHKQLSEHWPLLYFDEVKIHQALHNLLSNAFKYSPEGGDIIISSDLASRNGQQYFLIRIEDNGIGLSPSEIERLGERFYRVAGLEGISGSGLGVSLVMEIVELHKGLIEFSSKKGCGTKVSVLFPTLACNKLNVAI